MDKHNSQQKSKSKNLKKPSASHTNSPALQEPAAKEDAVALQGKKTKASADKKK